MYAEHSAVVIMILSRLFHERFSGLGSVVFDFFFSERSSKYFTFVFVYF